MDGCQYMKRSFTLPAGSANITQIRWDLTFLTKQEFMEKHKASEAMYTRLTQQGGPSVRNN